jgi:protein gp37
VDWYAFVGQQAAMVYGHGVEWVIVGGESVQGKAQARPFDVSWAQQTIATCGAARVPVFVKQLGSNPYFGIAPIARGNDGAGADPAEWADELRVQQFPR